MGWNIFHNVACEGDATQLRILLEAANRAKIKPICNELLASLPVPRVIKQVIASFLPSPFINVRESPEKRRCGRTPLMLATSHGVPILKLLIEAGADPTITDAEGRTALDKVEAIRRSHRHEPYYDFEKIERLREERAARYLRSVTVS